MYQHAHSTVLCIIIHTVSQFNCSLDVHINFIPADADIFATHVECSNISFSEI